METWSVWSTSFHRQKDETPVKNEEFLVNTFSKLVYHLRTKHLFSTNLYGQNSWDWIGKCLRNSTTWRAYQDLNNSVWNVDNFLKTFSSSVHNLIKRFFVDLMIWCDLNLIAKTGPIISIFLPRNSHKYSVHHVSMNCRPSVGTAYQTTESIVYSYSLSFFPLLIK